MITLMKTNSKRYLNNIQKAILEAIDLTPYDIDMRGLTDLEKVEDLMTIFDNEYGWNRDRYPNRS